MEPVCLHDQAEIEAFLRRDTFLHIYGIGDLDPFFWPHTTWYALKEAETIRAIALLYTAGSLPVLLALAGDNLPLMGDLPQSLLHLLPRRFYCHLSAGLDRTLAQEYRLEEHGKHLKMALRDKTLLAGMDTSNVVRLSPADVSDMLALYEESYSGHWFEPRMLETEQYYGIRGRDALISVAGVHVYSPRYGVAALGNITTHPGHRGQGYGAAVTAGLCKGLSETVEHIGLNVKADNRAALACYGKLGFEVCASYLEYMAETKSVGIGGKMYVAVVGLLLGVVALILDLGNRLFGSYARSLAGTTSRVLLVVVLSCLFATPALILAVNPESTSARHLVWAFGVLGVLIFFHFLFPGGWGIRKSKDSVLTEFDAPLTPGVTVHDAVIRAPAVPEGLEGLRFLVLSDLHCNTARQLVLLRGCVDSLRDPEPDFVFVLGDFGENKSLLPAVIEALGRLSGRFGRFSVRGNHDFERGRDGLVKQLLAEHAIRLLANEVQYVPEVGVSIVGLELPWNKAPLPSVDSPGFIIGLSHTPDNLPALADLGVDVVFAGHTHGGMVRLPLVGSLLVPSKYGRLLRAGWFRCGGSVMYVTRGLGYLPGRLGGTGEVLRLTARSR